MNGGRSDFDRIFEGFEDAFSDIFSNFPNVPPDWSRSWTLSGLPGFTVGFSAKSKLPNCIVSSAYPPANFFFDKDKNYRLQIACAGYDGNAIDIEFDDPSLAVTFKGKSPFEDSPCMFQAGVKKIDDGFTVSYAVDTRKFDVDKLTYTIKNGLLDIVIPPMPKKKFKVSGEGDNAKD